MSFWTESTFQPKRANRFKVELRPIDAVNSCGTKRRLKTEIDWHYVVSVQKPSYSMNVKFFNYINTQVRFAQPIKWNPITITLLDVVDKNILETIKKSQKEYLYKKDIGYKFQSTPDDSWASGNEIDIYQLDEDGNPIEKWSLENSFFTSIKYSNLDYNSENLSTIQITIEYDDAHLVALRSEIGSSKENYMPENQSSCPDELSDCIEERPPIPPPPVEQKMEEEKTPKKEESKTVVEDLSADVLFKKASSDLSKKGKALLDELSKKLGTERKVDITGFASIEGSEEYNMSLSQDRANAVAEYLSEKGVNVDDSIGMGETNQFNKNKLSPNRRVQVTYEQSSGDQSPENTVIDSTEPESTTPTEQQTLTSSGQEDNTQQSTISKDLDELAQMEKDLDELEALVKTEEAAELAQMEKDLDELEALVKTEEAARLAALAASEEETLARFEEDIDIVDDTGIFVIPENEAKDFAIYEGIELEEGQRIIKSYETDFDKVEVNLELAGLTGTNYRPVSHTTNEGEDYTLTVIQNDNLMNQQLTEEPETGIATPAVEVPTISTIGEIQYLAKDIGLDTYTSDKPIPESIPVKLQENQVLVAGDPSLVLDFIGTYHSYTISYNTNNDPNYNLALPNYIIVE